MDAATQGVRSAETLRLDVEYLAILQVFWTSVFDVERAVGQSFVP